MNFLEKSFVFLNLRYIIGKPCRKEEDSYGGVAITIVVIAGVTFGDIPCPATTRLEPLNIKLNKKVSSLLKLYYGLLVQSLLPF